MTHKISILFYGKKSRTTKDDMVPIYIRITVNGIRVYDCSTSKLIEVTKWSPEAGKVKGNSEEARITNNYLDALKNKVHSCERQMIQDNIEITPDSFKEKWSGIAERPRMLMEVFQHHNDQLKELLGKEYSPATWNGTTHPEIIRNPLYNGNTELTT
jgi:hypothetical protein